MTENQDEATVEDLAVHDTTEITREPGDPDHGVVPLQYGVGPFSVREVALLGVWLVAFVVSFFSLSPIRFESVWTAGLQWILTIAVPTVAVFLIVLRRLSPDGIRRVGSLGIDQFASVAFSVSAVTWLTYLWETIAFAITGGIWIRSWVMWVEFILMLAGVVLTVFAPLIPALREDFRHRAEIVAHPNARPLRPVAPRPPVERPVREPASEPAAAPEPAYGEDTAPADARSPYAGAAASDSEPLTEPLTDPLVESDDWAPVPTRDSYEPAVTEYDAGPVGAGVSEPVRQQAFWALAPEERDVHDETGAPVFRIGPNAWALVIEDRGDVFVMRHEDGRIGYLHDVTGVTRG